MPTIDRHSSRIALIASAFSLLLTSPATAESPQTPDATLTPATAFELVRPSIGDRGWAVPMHPNRLVPVRGGLALLMSGAPVQCTICKTVLGVAYLRRTPAGWRPGGVWQRAYEDFGFNHFNDMVVVGYGRAGPLVAIYAAVQRQGCVGFSAGVIELAPSGPIVHFSGAPTGGDNTGSVDERKEQFFYHAEISALEGGRGVKVRYTGRLRGHRVDQTVIYSGPGGRWRARPHVFDPQGCSS